MTPNQTPINDEVIEAIWRSTKAGGFTRPIALRREGNRLRVVNPRRLELSRSGHHGIWIYRRGDLDVLLYLEVSNSGKHSVVMEICDLPRNICDLIYNTAYNAWVIDGAYYNEVERRLELIEL
jgi:hypothetical protein